MRIAILTNDYPPNARGGAGVIAEIYATALKERGHEVMIEVCRPSFARMSAVRRLIFHLTDLFPRQDLIKKIVAWKPDTLLTHNLMGCGIGTPRGVQHHGIRWVHVLHDVQLIEPSGRMIVGESVVVFRAIWRRMWATLHSGSVCRPDVVVSPTKWLLDFHRRFGLFRTTEARIIPNPVLYDANDESRITNVESRNTREREGILYVGRLDPEKGVRILVDAWRALGDARPVLHLVGSGSLEGMLQKLNDSKLVIHGQLPNEETRTLMRSAATLVVPSLLIENQPTVILEGLASGCHVIASDVGGIPETLGVVGRIVPAGNVAALTAALSESEEILPLRNFDAPRSALLAVHRVDVAVAALESVLKSNL